MMIFSGHFIFAIQLFTNPNIFVKRIGYFLTKTNKGKSTSDTSWLITSLPFLIAFVLEKNS